jgi:hypothetical protein
MAKKRVSRESLYDLLERSNKVISKVHEVGTDHQKQEILSIGFDINSGVKLTFLISRFQEWFHGVMRYFPEDKEAAALFEEAKQLHDSNPHNEWQK